jgi:transcriptional regulator with XRE-family HTH domain
MDEVTIGARLRILRRWRGLTQVELAGLAGISPSFVSMVETGQRPLDRRSQIAALASALRVSEADLAGGPHLTADRQQSDPHAAIPSLRVALQTNTLTSPSADRARPLDGLARLASGRLPGLLRQGDYTAIGDLLPGVLDELHVHAAVPDDEQARRTALRALVEACVCGAFMARHLNYADLAHLAARRAQEAAALLDDPVAQGKAAFVVLHTLPRAGSLDRNLAAAEKAANALEPAAGSSSALPVLGMLTLTASLAAATLQRPDTAQDWLSRAAGIADRMPDAPMVNWQSFSVTNVSIWRVTIGVETGQTGGAIRELAARVRLGKLASPSSRKAAFLADVGCGLAREPGTRGEAIGWLRQAEETAPQMIRNSTTAREAVAYLLNRATAVAGGRELRGMAARMGLPH